MTPEETKQVLTYLKVQYPKNFEHLKTDEDARMYLAIWHDSFKNEDKRLVQAAVKKCVDENTTQYAPTIGQIRNKMVDLTHTGGMDAEEAWNMARRFWSSIPSDNAWEIEEDWRKLPESIRRIYSPADMVELGFRTNSHDITAYEKPRFLKQWAGIKANGSK